MNHIIAADTELIDKHNLNCAEDDEGRGERLKIEGVILFLVQPLPTGGTLVGRLDRLQDALVAEDMAAHSCDKLSATPLEGSGSIHAHRTFEGHVRGGRGESRGGKSRGKGGGGRGRRGEGR